MDSFRRSLLTHVVGTLKVTAYLCLLSLVAVVFTTRAARGALGEVSLSLARQLNEVPDLIGSTKLIELNGQSFRVSTSVVPFSAAKVLDRFAEACSRHPGELSRVAAQYGVPYSGNGPAGSGEKPLVRSDGADDGVLGCLIDSSSSVKGTIADVVREFARGRDASVFGDFLVVYAKNDGDSRSHVVAVWTRGPLKVLDLFPAQGDAPGSDSALLGRPRGARRLLSASAEGQPYGVHIYESSEAPALVQESVARDLRARGWSELSPQASGQARAFQHSSGVLALLTVGSNAGKTTVAMLEMGNGDLRTRAPR